MTTKTLRPEVYEQAAEMVERAWWKGGEDDEFDEGTPDLWSMCAGLAIERAAGGADEMRHLKAFARHLHDDLGHITDDDGKPAWSPDSIGIVYGWNDAKDRTKGEVLAELRAFAGAL